MKMSSSIYDRFVTKISSQCGINDAKTLAKTKELLITLDRKLPATLNCSESCKVVICLEVATKLTGSAPLNRDEAIKYSGCKKKVYTNVFNNISKLLNVDKVYTVRDLCVLVGVSEICSIAEEILHCYISKQNLDKTDREHPMFPSASVYTVCKINKIKVNKNALIEVSRIKKIEFDELVSSFQQIMEQMKTKKRKKEDEITTEIKDGDDSVDFVKKVKSQDRSTKVMNDNQYEDWKRRMLED